MLHGHIDLCMAVSNFHLFCATAAVAVAIFINLPAPRFSQRLEEWRNKGQYFNYKGNAIFYQGKHIFLARAINARFAGLSVELKSFQNFID